MAFPTIYDVTYSYTGFSASLGNGSFPGTQLDADLAGLDAADANILAFLQISLRSDGKLANQSVGPDQISPALSLGFTNRGTWAADQMYSSGDGVALGQMFYSARLLHVSTALNAPDVDSATWMPLFSFASVAIIDGSIEPSKLDATQADGFRTAIAAASTTDVSSLASAVAGLDTAKLDKSQFPVSPAASGYIRRNPANTVYETRSSSQVAADVIPVGFVMFSPKGTVVDGWLACEGGAFSQLTYPALYAYLGNSTTLPDYRDRVLRGAGTLAGVAFTTQEDAMQRITGAWETKSTATAGVPLSKTGTGAVTTSTQTGPAVAEQGTTTSGSNKADVVTFDSGNSVGAKVSNDETRVKAAIGKWVIKAH